MELHDPSKRLTSVVKLIYLRLLSQALFTATVSLNAYQRPEFWNRFHPGKAPAPSREALPPLPIMRHRSRRRNRDGVYAHDQHGRAQPEKAGVGGSIPFLATIKSITYRISKSQFHSVSFQKTLVC